MAFVFDNPYRGPKIDLDEEFRKKGLSEKEIKEIWKRIDEKIEKKKKHWFWKYFSF